jgi:TetR/AcrR family transcriptional regulator, acrAB operon repressor
VANAWPTSRARCGGRSVRGELAKRMPVATAALGLQSLLDGLLQNWMLDPGAFDLVKVGAPVLDAYLSSLAAPPG